VVALDRFGHDPAYPVTSNWPKLRDQLIHFIEREVPAAEGPPVLVGHSLGGLLSVLAASKRPDLARALVVLDSPIVTGWRAHSLRAIKAAQLLPRISPGRIAQRRRYEWPSREAVKTHFARKQVFARWDARVLDDYVASGFTEADGKTVLAFQREVEARIYNTLPHHIGATLKRHPLRCPLAFIAGTQSVEMRQGGLETSRALARERFVWIEGTHLYPMEKPDATADQVLRLLDTF
jgi:pimeloyl-ACP methyl ester carboxylesterase